MTCSKWFKIKLAVCSAAVLLLIGTVTAFAGVILGDADGDGRVTINDVTDIQKTLAELPVSGFSDLAADVDGSGVIDIGDATCIQMRLADMATPYAIGEQIVPPTEPTTAPPTQPTTAAPTQRPTDADGWGRVVFRP